jgi:hypothetical protein
MAYSHRRTERGGSRQSTPHFAQTNLIAFPSRLRASFEIVQAVAHRPIGRSVVLAEHGDAAGGASD